MDERSPFLHVTPEELRFDPPYDRVIQMSLQLSNTSPTMSMAFKKALKSKNLVFLNVMKDPPKDIKNCHDKFQVLESVSEEEINEFVKDQWNTAPKESQRSQKIPCRFSTDGGAPPVSRGFTSAVDDKALRYKNERDRLKRELELSQRAREPVRQAQIVLLIASAFLTTIVPLLIAFVLGYILAKFF